MSPSRSGRVVAAAIACTFLAFNTCLAAGAAPPPETLAQALASAYANNPTLNAQRASLRATDEDVPQALAGFRPTIAAGVSGGITDVGGAQLRPWAAQITATQPLFAGMRNVNGVKAAETAVLAARETLRNTEQSTLLAAVQAFVDLVQAQATLDLQRQNVGFLMQQVKAASDELDAGEGTRVAVAQTKASLAAGQASLSVAVSSLNAAMAAYEQVIGHRPTRLSAAQPVDALLPKDVSAALSEAMASHPAILAAGYGVDAAGSAVKIAEGALLPVVSLVGTVTHADGDVTGQSAFGGQLDSASAIVNLKVPIYSGGGPSSEVRQAKENLGQARIQLDAARDQVREQTVSAWGMLDAARSQITAAQSEVSAQSLVLSGTIEALKVGQSTTLDVLNAQQTLLSARVALVSAQHDQVVASYTLLADIGRLNAEALGLKVALYDPTRHYSLVRDSWAGLRTPDGR